MSPTNSLIMAKKPTFVVITGSWHQAFHYDHLVEGLRERGFKVICYTNPSNANISHNFPEDLEFASYLIKREVEKGSTVDVIAHSYGGMIAASAAKDLGLASRKKEGKAGGVRNLYALVTFFVAGDPKNLAPWIELKVN
jgi:alpha-beta hydrolase superfamily lysophospholipase